MPRLKNKPPKESKKERKARLKAEEKKAEEASPSTSEPAAPPPPPPQKQLEVPPEFLEDIENDEERHKFINSALIKVKEVADIENEVRREIREFHGRIRKTYASDMNSKEMKEASSLYEKLAGSKDGHYEYMNALLNRMKTWRSEAANKAKASGELNALELLKARHGCLPVMDIATNLEPYGTGALAWPDTTRPTKGDEVVAFVEESKTWIVAEVSGSKSNHRYECVDVDDEEKKVSTFARKQIIPLPKYTCDYGKYPFMAFKPNAHVLALFPGTTCFYPGIVRESPTAASGLYLVSFVDTEDTNKFAEPVEVSDRYIVAWRKDPKMYIRPEKRMQLETEAEGVAVEEVPSVLSDTKKKSHKKKVAPLEEEIPDRDIPGPAPKAQPVSYYESPDEDAKKVKRGKKKDKKVKVPKIKIRRARVPEHKKKQHTRLFGKRRKNKKPKVTVDAEAAGPSDVKDAPPTDEGDEDVVEVFSGDLEKGAECTKKQEQLEESGEDELDDQRGVDGEEVEDEDEEQEDEEQPSNETEGGASGELSFPKFDESDNESEKSSEDEEEDLVLPELEEDIPTGYPNIQSDDSSDDSSCDSDAGSYICKKDTNNKSSDDSDDL